MINNIPQDLIDTTIDILEARRNPELNPKIGPYTKLKNHPKVESIKTISIARKGFLDASEMPIIISRVDPNKFREIEEEVDTLEELLERV
jgi:hypothetical protein